MLDNPSANFGWIMVGSEIGSSTSKRYNPRENAGGGPILSIEYTEGVPNESSAWGRVKGLFR